MQDDRLERLCLELVGSLRIQARSNEISSPVQPRPGSSPQPNPAPTYILETDSLVVILKVPYALVQPTSKENLNSPSDGRDNSEYSSDDVGLGEHGDGVDQSCGAGRCWVVVVVEFSRLRGFGVKTI